MKPSLFLRGSTGELPGGTGLLRKDDWSVEIVDVSDGDGSLLKECGVDGRNGVEEENS